MRTIKEIKNDYALQEGFAYWDDLMTSMEDDIEFNKHLDNCIENAQKEILNEVWQKGIILHSNILKQIENQ